MADISRKPFKNYINLKSCKITILKALQNFYFSQANERERCKEELEKWKEGWYMPQTVSLNKG